MSPVETQLVVTSSPHAVNRCPTGRQQAFGYPPAWSLKPSTTLITHLVQRVMSGLTSPGWLALLLTTSSLAVSGGTTGPSSVTTNQWTACRSDLQAEGLLTGTRFLIEGPSAPVRFLPLFGNVSGGR